MSEALLSLRQVKKYFTLKEGWFSKPQSVRAVEEVSLDIRKGETFGLAGESGCGKSTLGRIALKLIPATSGQIIFNGTDISKMRENEMRPLRRQMQIIFQDPYGSLNPRMTVGSILGEALKIHNLCTRKQRPGRISELLEIVGLSYHASGKYPHEFSGGQRQRIGIARALAVQPQFIVADEPVSALDVSIQAQIVNLLRDLQARFRLTYLFISHDLDLLEFICNRIAIMYLGRIMELLPSADFRAKAQHPYSQALMRAIPHPDPSKAVSKEALSGELPSALAPPSGCVFHTRCPIAVASCRVKVPELREIAPGHKVACDLI